MAVLRLVYAGAVRRAPLFTRLGAGPSYLTKRLHKNGLGRSRLCGQPGIVHLCANTIHAGCSVQHRWPRSSATRLSRRNSEVLNRMKFRITGMARMYGSVTLRKRVKSL
jgi:hypothetical protein